MQYTSTRGNETRVDFRTALLSGLADDGGLYVPTAVPTFSQQDIASWSWLPFDELAWRVMAPFVGDTLDEPTLRALVSDSYRCFKHRGIAPLQQIGHNEWILQLFHGPTRSSRISPRNCRRGSSAISWGPIANGSCWSVPATAIRRWPLSKPCGIALRHACWRFTPVPGHRPTGRR